MHASRRLGSLLGNAGKWGACGWAVVQLDNDEEMVPLAWDVRLDGGRIRGSAHHQEGGVDSFLVPSSGKYVDPYRSTWTTRQQLMGYEKVTC